MPKFSEQDLKYATQLREEIHREALAIVKKTHPNVTEVIDRHPVEDYFQENWEYPGKLYTIVAIPYGYKSRKAFIDAIVRETISENEHKNTSIQSGEDDFANHTENSEKSSNQKTDSFYSLIAEYTDLVLDYFIIDNEKYCGYNSHKNVLKTAFDSISKEWDGNPDRAAGKRVSVPDEFSSNKQSERLNYRKAFLNPPYPNNYTDSDFERVNNVLFPNGLFELEIYEWNTDWSEYFDEGREWWGTLCLTIYDKTLDRFVVIMASATD